MTTDLDRMSRSLGAGAVLSGDCVDVPKTELERLRAELATLRESTRIRVTEEEPPENSIGTWVLAWATDDAVPTVMISAFVRADRKYTHWLPLPERPAR